MVKRNVIENIVPTVVSAKHLVSSSEMPLSLNAHVHIALYTHTHSNSHTQILKHTFVRAHMRTHAHTTHTHAHAPRTHMRTHAHMSVTFKIEVWVLDFKIIIVWNNSFFNSLKRITPLFWRTCSRIWRSCWMTTRTKWTVRWVGLGTSPSIWQGGRSVVYRIPAAMTIFSLKRNHPIFNISKKEKYWRYLSNVTGINVTVM